MPKQRLPSPASIAHAKQQISHVPNTAIALLGRGFDGSMEDAEQISALALTIESTPALTQAQIEHRLSTQMILLDASFCDCLTRANGTGQLKQKLALIDMAVRVQASSRKTALALDTIRNPKKPTQFIKNYVDRQLNQMVATPSPIPLPQDDRPNVEILDSRTATSAARQDSDLETVAKVHRGEDSARETHEQAELF